MSCTGRFAEASDFNQVMCAGVDLDDPDEVAEVNAILDLAASDLHVAMAAVGACDCTLSAFALTYLKKLNIIDAVVIHNCNCGGVHLTEDERLNKERWLETQLERIITGRVPLCDGDTGTDFPACGTAEMSYTGWSEAQILANEQRRKLS